MDVRFPIGGSSGYHPPRQTPEMIHQDLKHWLEVLQNEQHITPQHCSALLQELDTCHLDPEKMKNLAHTLFTHLPFTAPPPPVDFPKH